MRFQTPLVPGRLLRRYNRFLADVELDTGEIVKAHCPNPGSMMGLKDPGLRVWLEPNDDPKKKLKFGWRLAEMPSGAWVGIDTSVPNRVVGEALRDRHIPEVSDYATHRAEVRYSDNSRVDFLLSDPGLPDLYLEVKNVHLVRTGTLVEFPDSVTSRGAKHMGDLAKMVAEGHRAVLLYCVQYTGCSAFTLAEDLDPTYAAAYRAARDAGVETLCYDCTISPEGVRLNKPLPVEIP